MIRFIHLSDTHIATSKSFANYGHATYAHLERLVEVINNLPYDYDFILHSGDVTERGDATAYQNARELLAQLRKPVYYLTGNHDDSLTMERVLLEVKQPKMKHYYAFVLNGIQVIALDSKGTVDPSGYLDPAQLEFLKSFCTADSLPLVIWLHHQPLKLGIYWLDEHIFQDNDGAMYLTNYEEFQAILRPIRDRVRGIFFGHIHRAIQTVHDGILYSSAPSTFGQIAAYPSIQTPIATPDEAPGYCLVTVDEHGAQVQQYTFARPE